MQDTMFTVLQRASPLTTRTHKMTNKTVTHRNSLGTKAITTKLLAASTTLGTRIKATEMDGKGATIAYDYGLSGQENHEAAAIALCEKLNWFGTLASGVTNEGYVHVFTTRQ